MACTNLLNIGVLLIWAALSSTYADRCLKSFPSGTPVPNDELMTAFYLADPNPDTGYLNTVGYYSDYSHSYIVTAFMQWNKTKLSYESWLARGHDAQKEMTNLWSYLNRIIVSDVLELYCHYRLVVEQRGSKSRGIVNFDTISKLFYDVCMDWNTFGKKWPYSCFNSAFFCKMNYGMVQMRKLVYSDNWVTNNGQRVNQPKVKHFTEIEYSPKIGMEDSTRSDVVDMFFHPDILKFIPNSAQENVFYHSRLMWKSLVHLMSVKNSLNEFLNVNDHARLTQVERHIQKKCSEKSGQPVAVKYYCKAKAHFEKLRACSKLSDVTPCAYDNDFQEYFLRGRFGNMHLQMHSMISNTQTVLMDVKNKVVANDHNGLKSLYNKYNPYITVADSMCHLDWPMAFDCTNNVGCRNIDNFDCNGGYTCRINTMYRFDCILKFVLKQTKQLVDATASGNGGSSGVVKAKNNLILWLSYLPMARYVRFTASEIKSVILDTQVKVNEYVTSFDTDGLKWFISNLPQMSFVPQWAKNAACQQVSVPSEYTIFCNLDPVLNSVSLFVKAFENSKRSTTKILNPTVDYGTLLGQLQLDRAARLINLQTQEISNQFRSEVQNNFQGVQQNFQGVQQNFQELSSYFSSLANYDKAKADADIGYIDGRLTLFKVKISSISTSVGSKFQTILYLAIGINAAEIVGKAARLGVAIAQACNPLGKILGSSRITDLMDSINSLAQAGVTTAKIARLGHKEFPDLIKQASDLGTKFADNEAQLKDAKTFIDKMKKGEDAVGTANDFVGKYTAYTPKVVLPDITSYGAKWEKVAEELCEAAFSAETGVAALIEIGLASTGDCVNIGVEIQELITYYEELYDYQFDFMDSLSEAARAYLAYQKANDLKSAYTKKTSLNTAFLKQTAVNAFMVSTLNAWKIVTEYCDVLTYTRGGEVPDKCETALRTPSHNAVAQVMSYKPDPLCHTNNEITHYQDIPTKPTGANDKAYIDLKALYARKTVTFKIPSFQWLKDNGWFGPHDPEKAVYIKRFEIFLPPMSGKDEHLIEVEAQPGMANYLRYGGTKYLLPVTYGYTARYTENGNNCYNTKINNPYALCNDDDLAKLCITSNGYVNKAIQPSIYNEWKIKVNSLPAKKTAPQPATNFKIQAAITTCVVNLSPSATKRETPTLSNIFQSRAVNRTRRAAHHCCASNQYWTGSQCSNCPSGSSQQLFGYYCQ